MQLKLTTTELHNVIKQYVAELGLNLENKNVTIDINNSEVLLEVLPADAAPATKPASKPKKAAAKKEIETPANAFLQAEEETPVAPAEEDELNDEEPAESIFGQDALDNPPVRPAAPASEHSIFG